MVLAIITLISGTVQTFLLYRINRSNKIMAGLVIDNSKLVTQLATLVLALDQPKTK